MNDKKPLMDYRRAQKLQTPLLLTGALLSGVGTSVSVPLVILGIAIMLFAIVIGVLYYRCPHCGRPLGRIGEGGAYCPHCGKALNAPVEEPVRSITVPAYAKLNLTLDILGKRDDGYHEMQMVMQTVSLHDDVTVTLTDGKGITCRVDGAALPCDERNLAVKAARAFCEAMDYGGGIDIALIKRIPSEAGYFINSPRPKTSHSAYHAADFAASTKKAAPVGAAFLSSLGSRITAARRPLRRPAGLRSR